MHMFNKILFAGLFLFAMHASAQDQTKLSWGDVSVLNSDYYLIGNSEGQTFSGDALIAVGYFNTGFDVLENASDTQALYDNFTILTSSLIGENRDGVASGSVTIDTSTGSTAVGKTVYYWVLAGVTSYDENSVVYVAEYAIISDTTWGVIPSGGYPPVDYDIRVVNPDNVVYGDVVAGGGHGTANLYVTSPNSAVPEPAFYAAGLGLVALLVVQLRRRRRAA